MRAEGAPEARYPQISQNLGSDPDLQKQRGGVTHRGGGHLVRIILIDSLMKKLMLS